MNGAKMIDSNGMKYRQAGQRQPQKFQPLHPARQERCRTPPRRASARGAFRLSSTRAASSTPAALLLKWRSRSQRAQQHMKHGIERRPRFQRFFLSPYTVRRPRARHSR